MSWDKVSELLDAASHPYRGGDTPVDLRADHVFPGAVLLVGHAGEIVYHQAHGCRSLVPAVSPMREDFVFDVASLTKALITTTLIAQAVDRGALSLDHKLSRYIQSFASHGKDEITVRHLLAHCSGYPPTKPYFTLLASADRGERAGIMQSRAAVEFVYNEISRGTLQHVPGKVSAYSDIGFILLQQLLEVIHSGATLDKLAVKHIIAPLSLTDTGFIDLAKTKRRELEPIGDTIVPTLQCPWRKKVLLGEVHDDNAWAMGGVAGHAGLFSTAADVHIMARALLESFHGRCDLVSPATLKKFWTVDSSVSDSTWALGWDTPTPGTSSSGSYFSPQSVGHLAYTGCSLWIDTEREVDVVLLTNRIHPTADNTRIKEFRPVLHDLVMEALGYAA